MMHRQYPLKYLMSFFIISLITRMASGRYLNFWNTYQSKDTDDDRSIFQSEETNSVGDYGDESSLKKPIQDRYWVKVKITDGPRVTAVRGQSHAIKCEASGTPTPEIHWIRGYDVEKQILQLQERSVVDVESFRREPESATVQSTYLIDCVTSEDVGPIHCVAIGRDKIQYSSAVISVNSNSSTVRGDLCDDTKPPVIVHHISAILATQGSMVVLPCVAKSYPRAYTSWMTDDGDVIGNDIDSRFIILDTGELLINSLLWKDMGIYTCIAKSIHGEDRINTFIYPLKPSDHV